MWRTEFDVLAVLIDMNDFLGFVGEHVSRVKAVRFCDRVLIIMLQIWQIACDKPICYKAGTSL
jgi:hypothetical protein